ncbi:MAG: helix-turn-helix transcriptional regulator [Deltaproteobacteria bacterium]|jgi:putative molybdopterin biosynthesis protein|nr:helix-turn-helix transcriptional regulator [Deltaproteobacteria bacterium]
MTEQTTLTAQDVADLLRIAKNTVYELVKRGELNHYKVGRKMRFSRSDVERYISESRKGVSPEPRRDSPAGRRQAGEGGFIICGQDALLDVLTGFLSRRVSVDRPALRSYVGSYRGLVNLYHGEVQAATAHLWDGDTGQYNVPFVRRLLPGVPAVIVHLTSRVQGFYVPAGNPKGIKAWSDLKRSDLTIVNREKGAGSRVLLDEHLRQMGVRGGQILGYHREELSHLSVAGVVGRGEADLGVGDLKAASQVEGVDFLALQNEQYDLIFKQEDMDQPVVQAIIDIIRSKDFQAQFQHMRGYDVKGMGNIVAET